MTDRERKIFVSKARQKMEQQQAIIEGYSKQITELKHRNQELQRLLDEARQQLTAASVITQARLDEMDCEAYNL